MRPQIEENVFKTRIQKILSEVQKIYYFRKRLLALFGKNARETGLEPATSAVTGRCSNQLNYSRKGQIMDVGRNRTRTYDHLCVRQALYQLSYTPIKSFSNLRSLANFSQAILI